MYRTIKNNIAMKNISKELKLEIYTSNEFNRCIKLELAHTLPLLVKFIDKKIFTLKGRAKTFEIEFSKSLPIGFEGGFVSISRCYLTNKYNKLVLTYCLCFNGGSYDVKPSTAYTRYVERDVEIGTLENNEKLTSLFEFDDLVNLYRFNRLLNVETEIKAIEEYAKLKALTEEAKSKIKVSSDIYKYV